MAISAIYAGSFDPITNGHMDIIQRALNIFDEVYVSVIDNVDKRPLFSIDERMDMISNSVQSDRVVVEGFKGLLVDYARKKNIFKLIRGLRAVSDFDYEFQMAGMNSKLAPDIETIFLMASENLQLTSARFVKEIAFHSGKINNFVPDHVIKMFKKKGK